MEKKILKNMLKWWMTGCLCGTIALGLLGIASGCDRSLGSAGEKQVDGSVEVDASSGPDSGNTGQECISNEDCVVAVPYSCCLGCPEVMSREEMAALDPPCYYDGDMPPPRTIPDECNLMCAYCPPCYPQPLEAVCVQGQCVSRGEGCPAPGEDPPPRLQTADLLSDPQAHDNETVRMTGPILPGWADCDDNCPAPHCCDYAQLLDGFVRLTGSPCNLWLNFWSDGPCADIYETDGLEAGAWFELTGTVHAGSSAWDPVSLQVLGIQLVDPQGPGGVYQVKVTEVDADGSLPVCTPPEIEVGDSGRLLLGHAGTQMRALSPLFDCWWEFLGTFDESTDSFDASVPIDCDGCCCDYFLKGQVTGDTISGTYESFDGSCRLLATFSGQREP